MKNLQIDPNDLIHKPITYPPWLLKPASVDLYLKNYLKSDHSPSIIKNLYLEHIEKYIDYNPCYTDGSKIPSNHAGYAFSINDKTYNFKVHNCSSIFTAELIAILHCLLHIPTTNTNSKHFLVQSDSLSSLLSIRNMFANHPIIQKILNALFDLQNTNFTIQFMYVPSHIGISGNETVDTYAKSATDPSPLKIITSDDIKAYFNQITYASWQNFWTSQTSNKL